MITYEELRERGQLIGGWSSDFGWHEDYTYNGKVYFVLGSDNGDIISVAEKRQ